RGEKTDGRERRGDGPRGEDRGRRAGLGTMARRHRGPARARDRGRLLLRPARARGPCPPDLPAPRHALPAGALLRERSRGQGPPLHSRIWARNCWTPAPSCAAHATTLYSASNGAARASSIVSALVV